MARKDAAAAAGLKLRHQLIAPSRRGKPDTEDTEETENKDKSNRQDAKTAKRTDTDLDIQGQMHICKFGDFHMQVYAFRKSRTPTKIG